MSNIIYMPILQLLPLQKVICFRRVSAADRLQMSKKIRDVLSNGDQQRDLGPELASVASCLQDAGPIVVWLHGPMGAGKSALLSAFTATAMARGATVIGLDCRTIEPTVAGLINALEQPLGTSLKDLDGAAAALSTAGGRTILAFDNYEVFRLADAWLRRDFIPSLAASARVLLISREPPAAGWVSATEWRDHFLAVPIESSSQRSADVLLQRYRDEIPDTETRQAIDAASVVRRITRPMLSALCPQSPAPELFEKLATLSFVETRRDGLAVLDSLRKIISARLQAADINQYRQYQKQAWKLLRRQLKESAQADLWRCTADIIYLIQNPVIREAFFPSETSGFSVEPASSRDKSDVMDIVASHESEAAIEAMQTWWRHLPSAFHVVRDATGTVAGFYCMASPQELGASWMQSDPVARNWQYHLRTGSRAERAPSLFLRRWLSRENGEAPSAVQAAAWVDIKRTYLELRPKLRRVYLTLRDLGPYGAAATKLGFVVLDSCATRLSGTPYHTAMLDFGPGSVDGWICRLLAAELGITEDQLLDTSTRELVLNGKRIPLTPLEFDLVAMLESRGGEPVSREDLLQQVWGRADDPGSNVVDVLIRGLRKKCAADADFIETVRGVGYRLRTSDREH